MSELAGTLHDDWRAARWNAGEGRCEPRMKETTDNQWISRHGGATEVDIANTAYFDLPADWQAECRASVEVAAREMAKAVAAGRELDKEFVEAASDVIHREWLKRNRHRAPAQQRVPFAQLSQEDKANDRAYILAVLKLYGEPGRSAST